MLTATGSSEEGVIWLLVNPRAGDKVFALPLLHAALAKALKSPVSVAGVGMKAVAAVPSDRSEVL
jgi:hypothetical protein